LAAEKLRFMRASPQAPRSSCDWEAVVKKLLNASSLAAVATLLYPQAAGAQGVHGDSTEAQQDVIVTATKRAASVQDVPLSISIVGGEAAAEQHLKDGIALARQVPNLVAESAMGAVMPRFRLRGIGTNDFTPTTASPVGIYEDEVYISGASGQSQPVYDLDRVEVLRGPQGSLWGKNTTAGAIHYVTVKPTDATQGRAILSYGTDDTREAEAAIGGPLTDGTAYRVAGVYRHRDGQFRNDLTGDKAGDYDIWDLRGQLQFDLGSSATLRLKAHGGRSRQDQPLQHVGLLAGGTDFDGYAERDDRDALSNNGSGQTYAHRAGGSAHLDADLGGVRLTNIAAYEWNNSLIYSDDDANPVSNYHERYGGGSHTFTDELRLASQDGSPFGWIVGAYYLHDRTTSFGQLALYSSFDFGVTSIAYDLAVKTDNLAGFTSLNYRITPKLTITAGARYTWERKGVSGVAFDYVTNPANLFDTSRVAFTYIDTDRGIYRDSLRQPMPGPRLRKSWNRVTWDGSVDYKLDDDILLFGRVARGFRSGNYNSYVAAPESLSVYDPETLTSYEAGIKTALLDRHLTLNATAFHYDFDDMQVTVLQNVGTVTQNAASAKVDGFEIEGSLRPVPGLSFDAGYGFQRSKYGTFDNASVPFPINLGAPLDLSGQRLERAPRHTLNLAATYEVALGQGALRLNTDWRYTSRYRFHVWSDARNNTPAPFLADPATWQLVRDTFSQDALWLGNATISYRFGSGLEVAVWVKNMTDRTYNTNAFGMFFNRSISTYPGERRTGGLTLGYRF
jgi:iron complex outermembrane recepter protein